MPPQVLDRVRLAAEAWGSVAVGIQGGCLDAIIAVARLLNARMHIGKGMSLVRATCAFGGLESRVSEYRLPVMVSTCATVAMQGRLAYTAWYVSTRDGEGEDACLGTCLLLGVH